MLQSGEGGAKKTARLKPCTTFREIEGAFLIDSIILILPFVFGAVVGSFLNVCIYRIPEGISIVSPPSRCQGCGRLVPFYYNIPIFGYIFLGGRCAFCKVPLSLQYPFVEALTGVIAVALFVKFGLSLKLFAMFVFAAALVVITFIDLRLKIIPDVISIPFMLLGVILSFFLEAPGVEPLQGVVNSLIGMAAGGGFLLLAAAAYYYITGMEGMGGGDIKLLAMIGAFLGWRAVIVTVLAGSFLGAVIGAAVMLIAGKSSKYALPFGPFLAFGAFLHLFYGDELIRWYLMKATGQ